MTGAITPEMSCDVAGDEEVDPFGGVGLAEAPGRVVLIGDGEAELEGAGTRSPAALKEMEIEEE